MLWPGERAAGAGPETEALAAQLEAAVRQIEEYFRGERRQFEVELDLQGTEFQRRVWREIARIPYAETRAYAAIAERAGRSGAARAAGAATGRNPAPVLVPCHRVVGTDGALRGFAGGLKTKRALLAHEVAVAGSSRGERLPGF